LISLASVISALKFARWRGRDRSFYDDKVFRFSALDRPESHAAVKADESAPAFDGKSEEINVGDLSVAHQMIGFEQRIVGDRNRIGPKLMS
jgi:hypothetical protein